MTEPYQEKKIWQYALATGKIEAASKPIVSEHAAALSVNGQHWLTFICSPTDLKALALGFLYGENVIKNLEEVSSIHLEDGGKQMMVSLTHPAEKPTHFHRTSTGYSLDPGAACRVFHPTSASARAICWGSTVSLWTNSSCMTRSEAFTALV